MYRWIKIRRLNNLTYLVLMEASKRSEWTFLMILSSKNNLISRKSHNSSQRSAIPRCFHIVMRDHQKWFLSRYFLSLHLNKLITSLRSRSKLSACLRPHTGLNNLLYALKYLLTSLMFTFMRVQPVASTMVLWLQNHCLRSNQLIWIRFQTWQRWPNLLFKELKSTILQRILTLIHQKGRLNGLSRV